MSRLVWLFVLVAAAGLAMPHLSPHGEDLAFLALGAVDGARRHFASMPEPFHSIAIGLLWLMAAVVAASVLFAVIRAVRLFIGWVRDAAV